MTDTEKAVDGRAFTLDEQTVKCKRGHEVPRTAVTVYVGARKLIHRDYCAVCWAEWMGDMFPLAENNS